MNLPVALNQGIPVIDLNADPLAAAAWIVKFLKARGVDRVFGLQGPYPADLGLLRPRGHPHRRRSRRGRGRPHGPCPCGADGPARRRHGHRRPGVTNCVTAMANASHAPARPSCSSAAALRGHRPIWVRSRHSPCRQPAVRSAASRVRCASPDQVNPRVRRGRVPRPSATWANRGRSISKSDRRAPHNPFSPPCAGGLAASEAAADHPARARRGRGGEPKAIARAKRPLVVTGRGAMGAWRGAPDSSMRRAPPTSTRRRAAARAGITRPSSRSARQRHGRSRLRHRDRPQARLPAGLRLAAVFGEARSFASPTPPATDRQP